MKLKEILKQKGSKVWSVHEHDTVRHAIEVLVHEKIGAVLVVDQEDRITGILSERDIVRGCYRSTWVMESMPVTKLMTRGVIVAGLDDEVKDVMGMMTEHRVRHMPVVSEKGLEGMISIGDVVKATLDESAYEVKSLKNFIYGDIAE